MAEREPATLEGAWKVAMEVGGRKLTPAEVPEFTFVVGSGGKATGRSAQGEYCSTLSVAPKTFVNLHETGPTVGLRQYAVYRVENDRWTVCITAPGAAEAARPASFDTKGTADVVFVFERVAPTTRP